MDFWDSPVGWAIKLFGILIIIGMCAEAGVV